MGYSKDDSTEQILDLTYKVRVRTHGKASKHIDQIGETLARLLELNFTDAEVTRGKTVYRPACARLVDSGNDTAVV